MSAASDLEARVARRKQELISELVEHKKNCSRACAPDAIDRIKDRLSELAQILKDGLAEGWANVGPSTKVKLDGWIARADREMIEDDSLLR